MSRNMGMQLKALAVVAGGGTRPPMVCVCHHTLILLVFGFLLSMSGFAEETETPLFTMGAIADPQYADTPPRGARSPREVPRRLQTAVDHFNRHQVDFVMSLGDFIDWDDMDYDWPPKTDIPDATADWKHFETLDRIWQTIEAPRYHVMGNHEWYVPDVADDGEKPGRVFRKFGFKDKAYHDFTLKGFRFVVLDGNDRYMYAYPKGSEAYEDAKAYYDAIPRNTPARRDWNGAISQKQLDWLDATLADAAEKGQRAVVCCHYPIHLPVGGHHLLNHAAVREVLDRHENIALWLNGHNHRGDYALVHAGKPNQRHHLNFMGMQNRDGCYYRLKFFEDRVEVLRAENTEPEHSLSFNPVSEVP